MPLDEKIASIIGNSFTFTTTILLHAGILQIQDSKIEILNHFHVSMASLLGSSCKLILFFAALTIEIN